MKFEYIELTYNIEDINNIIPTIVKDVTRRTFDYIPLFMRSIAIVTGEGGLELIYNHNQKYPKDPIDGIHLKQQDTPAISKYLGEFKCKSSYILDVYVAGQHIARYIPIE